MNGQPHAYMNVPVIVAAQIGEQFAKDVVVILCWDASHNLVHTTTWGRAANDKLIAAAAGAAASKAFGSDIERKIIYEDFRLDAGRWKEHCDHLIAALRHVHHCRDCKEGLWDDCDGGRAALAAIEAAERATPGRSEWKA
jgi:hypothetical protein